MRIVSRVCEISVIKFIKNKFNVYIELYVQKSFHERKKNHLSRPNQLDTRIYWLFVINFDKKKEKKQKNRNKEERNTIINTYMMAATNNRHQKLEQQVSQLKLSLNYIHRSLIMKRDNKFLEKQNAIEATTHTEEKWNE